MIQLTPQQAYIALKMNVKSLRYKYANQEYGTLIALWYEKPDVAFSCEHNPFHIPKLSDIPGYKVLSAFYGAPTIKDNNE